MRRKLQGASSDPVVLQAPISRLPVGVKSKKTRSMGQNMRQREVIDDPRLNRSR